jgi:hypothetical protein
VRLGKLNAHILGGKKPMNWARYLFCALRVVGGPFKLETFSKGKGNINQMGKF